MKLFNFIKLTRHSMLICLLTISLNAFSAISPPQISGSRVKNMETKFTILKSYEGTGDYWLSIYKKNGEMVKTMQFQMDVVTYEVTHRGLSVEVKHNYVFINNLSYKFEESGIYYCKLVRVYDKIKEEARSEDFMIYEVPNPFPADYIPEAPEVIGDVCAGVDFEIKTSETIVPGYHYFLKIEHDGKEIPYNNDEICSRYLGGWKPSTWSCNNSGKAIVNLKQPGKYTVTIKVGSYNYYKYSASTSFEVYGGSNFTVIGPDEVTAEKELTYTTSLTSGMFSWNVEPADAVVSKSSSGSSFKFTLNENSSLAFVKSSVIDSKGCKSDFTKRLKLQKKQEIPDIEMHTQYACKNSTVSFSIDADEGYTYTWDIDNSSNGTLVPDKNKCDVMFNDITTATITCEVNDGNYTYTKTKSVQLKDLEVSPFVAEQNVCDGASSAIEGPSSTKEKLSYLWYKDNSTGESLDVNVTADTDFKVKVTNQFGCAKDYTVSANVMEKPNINYDVLKACEGIAYDFTGPDNSGENYQSYNWVINDVAVPKKNVNDVLFTEDTEISLEINYVGECKATYTQTIDFIEKPDYESSDTALCSLTPISFEAPHGTGYQYLWRNETDNKSLGATRVIFEVPDKTTLYTVKITDADGCSNTYEKFVEVEQPEEIVLENFGTNILETCIFDTLTLTAPSTHTGLSWSTGETAQSILINKILSSRTITVSGYYNGCYTESDIDIFVNPLPDFSLTGNSSVCEGQKSSLEITGDGNYIQMDWSLGNDNVKSNEFYLTGNTTVSCYVTDENLCSKSISKTIVVNPNPVFDITDKYTCEGVNLNVTAPGGYDKYAWSNGITTATATFTAGGDKNCWLKLTDANGCYSVDDFTITEYNVNKVSMEPVYICEGEVAKLKAASNFTGYSWDNGALTPSIEVSPVEDYTYGVQLTDANGCTQDVTVDVFVRENPYFTMNNVYGCEGELVSIDAPGGFYDYNWSNGSTLPNITFTATNNAIINLTVFNEYGCSYTNGFQFIVKEVPEFNLLDNAICNGSEITYTAPGGKDSYTWSTGESSQSVTLSPSTTTEYTATVEENGCSYTDKFTVEVNSFVTFAVDSKEICKNTTTTLKGPGGCASYIWSNGETTQDIDVTPLSSRTYTVTITDMNGCTGSASADVTVNDNISITIPNQQICLGDYANVDGPPNFYSYSWSNGSSNRNITTNPSVNTNYTLTVEDENGCSGSATMTVIVNVPEDVTMDDVTMCKGESKELTAPINYTDHTWNGKTKSQTYTVSPIANSVINLDMKDANGCKVSTTVDVYVNKPPQIFMSDRYECKFKDIIITSPGKFDGYSWSNGSTENYISLKTQENQNISLQVTDVNGCTGSASFNLNVYDQTLLTLDNAEICLGQSHTFVPVGDFIDFNWSNGKKSKDIIVSPTADEDYNLIAYDINGCSATASATVVVNEHEGFSLTDYEVCFMDTVILTGPAAQSNYDWSIGKTTQSVMFGAIKTQEVTLTATDVNGCTYSDKATIIVNKNPVIALESIDLCMGQTGTLKGAMGYPGYLWSNGKMTKDIDVTLYVSNSYKLTVTDVKGCKGSATANVTVHDNPSVTLPNFVICEGEYLNIEVDDEFDSYRWNTGNIGRMLTVKPSSDGDYTVTVKDQFGCSATASSSVIVHSRPTFNITDKSLCFGDSAYIVGPVAMNDYNWSTGQNGQTVYIKIGKSSTLSLEVTDVNGCKATDEFNITVFENPYFKFDEQNICLGNNATLTGPQNFSGYLWSNGLTSQTIIVNPVSDKNYGLKVTDVNGCSYSDSVAVNVHPLPDVYLEDVIACKDEVITLEAGEGNKSYSWSNGIQNVNRITFKADADQTIGLTVIDYNNCMNSTAMNVTVFENPVVQLTDVTACKGEKINKMAPFGFAKYFWTTKDTTNIISLTAVDNSIIGLTVWDDNGCKANDFFNLDVNPSPFGELSDIVVCNGQTVDIGVIKEAGCTYNWSSGDTSSFIEVTPKTNSTYSLQIKNSYNCVVKDTVRITVNTNPSFCLNNVLGKKDYPVTLVGPSGDFSYLWSNGETSKNIQVKSDTNSYYYLYVSDNNNCNNSAQSYVNVEPQIKSMSICKGENCKINVHPGFSGYKWSTGDTTTTINSEPLETTSYFVTVTDAFGNTDVLNSKVIVNEIRDIPLNDTTVCNGGCLKLSLPANYYKYYWSTGEDTTTVIFDSIFSPFYYSVDVQNEVGCNISKTNLVDVFSADFDFKTDKQDVQPGGMVKLSVLKDTDKVKSCSWKVGDILVNEQSEPNVYLYSEGMYDVEMYVTDIYSCNYTIKKEGFIKVDDNVNGVTNVSGSDYIKIYPNPFNDNLVFSIDNKALDIQYIEVYSIEGRKMYMQNVSSDRVEIDLSLLTPGMYMFKAFGEKTVYQQKIIKE